VRGDIDYTRAVQDLNRDKQQTFERMINEEMADGEVGAFLAWGDPALYDSTIRILQAILASGRCVFEFEVIPGITSVQALAAQHKVPLNRHRPAPSRSPPGAAWRRAGERCRHPGGDARR